MVDCRFVVAEGSQSGPTQRVCVVDSDGHLLSCHGGLRGGGPAQLDFPRHLAVDDDGELLVADFNNRRVVRLTWTLELLGEINLPVGPRQNFCPYRLCVDQRQRRLYVGGLGPGSDCGRLAAFRI